MELQTVPLEDVVPPERSDKLHPHEKEDDEDWEDFVRSVGTEPNKPLDVIRENGSYHVIDGDRRFRALEQNGADEVRVLVADDLVGDDLDQILRMVTANEFREPSDKRQRARKMAQISAPWLLPSGEREDIGRMTQAEVSEEIGKTQPTISNWLNPIKNEYPLRSALAEVVGVPDDGEMEEIDEICDLLLRGGDDGSLVISIGQEQFVANEIADMEGVSLGELYTSAEKAVAEDWNAQRFLEYVDKNFAYDDMTPDGDVEAGVIGENPEFEDTSFDEESDDSPDPTEDLEIATTDIDVDWSEHVDESNLNKPLSKLEQGRMLSQTIEDDAAVAINILAARQGMSQQKVMSEIIEPLIVDETIGLLQGE